MPLKNEAGYLGSWLCRGALVLWQGYALPQCVCSTRPRERMLILSWSCFLFSREENWNYRREEQSVWRVYSLFQDIKMTYRLLDLIPDLHLYLPILGLGPCRKTYDSRKEQFPLIHLELWLNLLGKFMFYLPERSLISLVWTILKGTQNLRSPNQNQWPIKFMETVF